MDIRRAFEQDRRKGRRPRGLASSLRQLRQTMDRMRPADFTDADRTELELWVNAIQAWARPPRSRRRVADKFELAITPVGWCARSSDLAC
jgi:hypothetical protein